MGLKLKELEEQLSNKALITIIMILAIPLLAVSVSGVVAHVFYNGVGGVHADKSMAMIAILSITMLSTFFMTIIPETYLKEEKIEKERKT